MPAAVVALGATALLLVPEAAPHPPHAAAGRPFVWNQDERWRSLEESFRNARAAGCASLAPRIDAMLRQGRDLLARATQARLAPDDALLDEIERTTFELGPTVAACPDRLPEYLDLAATTRSLVKRQSRGWDMSSRAARDRLYRLLYGGRAAVEEALLQAPRATVPALARGDDEPSSTPAAEILRVRVHSGDVLLSRGGAPTSALIARGNDYPGNFSHVALVCVEGPGEAVVVESHIERGVAVATVPAYLADVKLRVMVLRLRADLPQLAANPMLPHRAATAALAGARSRHIPYDFAMDFTHHDTLFCSEVASAAYARYGVTLWMGLSHISSPGLASWLAGFGVTHFETQEPSDLEYDPQLTVVAEWRDPLALLADHLDNAVVDVMLEGAERGDTLDAPAAMLPAARLAKLYSSALNLVGAVGPVPEGLSAGGALRTRQFMRRHALIRERLLRLEREFERAHGYVPPYWELVALARQAAAGRGGAGG